MGLNFAKQFPLYQRFLIKASYTSEPSIRNRILDELNCLTDKSLQMKFNQAINKGEVRSDIDQEFLVKLMKFLLQSFGEVFITHDGDMDEEEMILNISRYIKFLRDGLAGPALK